MQGEDTTTRAAKPVHPYYLQCRFCQAPRSAKRKRGLICDDCYSGRKVVAGSYKGPKKGPLSSMRTGHDERLALYAERAAQRIGLFDGVPSGPDTYLEGEEEE